MCDLSIVSLNVESSDSGVVFLYYLHTRHEPCYSDVVGHGLGVGGVVGEGRGRRERGRERVGVGEGIPGRGGGRRGRVE